MMYQIIIKPINNYKNYSYILVSILRQKKAFWNIDILLMLINNNNIQTAIVLNLLLQLLTDYFWLYFRIITGTEYH